jgi:outer membrane protein assembly factor BamA
MNLRWSYNIFLLAVFLVPYVFIQAQPALNDSTPVPVFNQPVSAIDTGYAPFKVNRIIITGNKKTKNKVILRELPFKEGEEYQLPELVKKFENARTYLMNTALFVDVVVALKSFNGYDVDILVAVKERWYLFPVPYFKPIDRNLNQWLVEKKASLTRVNYGIKLLYDNVSGRNDKLKFYLTNGYTKEVSLSYDRPYVDKRMKWGLSLSVATGENHEVNYNTINNKQAFIKDPDNFIRNYFRAAAEISYRRVIKTRHRFGIVYTSELIEDTVLNKNPKYFNSVLNRISFPDIYYDLNLQDVNFIPYPLRGYTADVGITKRGFNSPVSVWQLALRGAAYRQLSLKYFFSLKAAGTIKLPFDHQPFINQRLLGYGDIGMQGYEYYVIDGVAGGYVKTTLSKEILKFSIKLPSKKKEEHESFNRIPFTLYAKIFGNTGYVYNPAQGNNFLANKMLYSGGVGLDIVTFYDFVLRFEWSFNTQGQNGLFLHQKTQY